jgi:hypothetical protein
MPESHKISAHDEAKYVESGKLLLKGEVRELALVPLVAVV